MTDGRADSLKRSFQVYVTLQRTMRCATIAVMLVAILLAPSVTAQPSGRDGPNCLDRQIDNILNTVTVDDGVCVKVDLGALQPGDVYEVSISIISDGIDLLFFDQNQILTYDAGQSYRTQYNQIISTENALGGYTFHWKVPASINPKTWYMVLDNLAHDGDNGQGDQGGSQSQIGVSFDKIQESYWTPFHDVVAVTSDNYATLLSGDSLRLDAGTTIVVTAWELEGQVDVYLQTRAMHDLYVSQGVGQLFIPEIDLQSISSSDSDTWTVPQELDGQELLVIVDNTNNPIGGGVGDSDIRVSVRVELAPVVNPIITPTNNGQTSIGVALSLDANNSPNSLGQIDILSWDLDSSVDTDGDGTFTNDQDSLGFQVDAAWNTIGSKEITLTIISKSGQIATTNYSVTVSDIVNPIPQITSSAESFSGGLKTGINIPTAFSCSSSSDDGDIAGCLWEWGGVSDSNNSASITWPNIGTYVVNLTVTDVSGNIGKTSANIVVDDSSIPVLNTELKSQLPSSIIAGESLTFSMSAIDAYDQSYQLQYYWDLNPSLDSDGNGDATDDPDFVGSDVELSFANSGTKDIVVTVFDQSGNSDSHAFSVNVASATEPTSMFGVIVISLFAFVVVMAVSMIGYRRWQTGIAVQLLQGRGLSEQEAKQHITMVKQKTRIPIFADAAQISGLDSNIEVTTKDSQQEQMHQAEYQSIYGGNNQAQSNTGSAFAPPANTYAPAYVSTPQPQYNTATHTAASDALAMFEEEENQEIIASVAKQDAVVKVTEVVSGGIELPFQVKSQIENDPEVSKPDKQIEPVVIDDAIKEVSCPLCDFSFKIRIPEVDEAIVACPSCNKDFKLRFE
ncbi:MAG: hypothetical protein ACJ0CN_01275 [Candidatus Poseidoniaceae archaeon]